MKTVFLDTVGLLAQWDESDQWHDSASKTLEQLFRQGVITVTTTFVLLECGNAAARRTYRQFVAEAREALEHAGGLIIPTPHDWEAAWAAYSAGRPGDAGIVDQISFAVMRRLGITDVFSNDRHFKAAGFNTLF